MKKEEVKQRFGSEFFDNEYFVGNTKSAYGDLVPGGYTKESFFLLKIEESISLLKIVGYTRRRAPDKILVAGCAMGYLVDAFQSYAKIETYGVDISEHAINKGRKEGVKNIRVGDVCDLHSFKNKEFELVVSLELLENIPHDEGQLERAINELARVTKNYLILAVRNGVDDTLPDQTDGPWKSHFSVHSPNWWANEFEKRGLVEYGQFKSNTGTIIILEAPYE